MENITFFHTKPYRKSHVILFCFSSHDFDAISWVFNMVGTSPSKVYGKQSWLILARSPAITAGIVEEKQPLGSLTVNKLASEENSKEELRCT